MFDEFVLAVSVAELSAAEQASRRADAVEFRMDLAENPQKQLQAYDGSLPIILTNRADWEGGEAETLARYDTLSDGIATDSVVAVDIEAAALHGKAPDGEQAHATALRETARDVGVAVIASVHDFEATPRVERLIEALEDAAAAGDIAKLATTVSSPADALAILRATHATAASGHTVATMGMGEQGRHTRAVTPLYGSRIGYAPVDSETATAPGQYSVAELSELIRTLETGSTPGQKIKNYGESTNYHE